jgi:glycosyltransferase involved in cell wall biosynthesis
MKSTNDPRVSVLMTVYNGEKYLSEAIDSILNQTFEDFEFIIIDDGSTDGSADIIQSYRDERIRFLRNGKNLSVPVSSNIGLKLSCGEYIARMDCDDISLPERLEKQVQFMDDHPEVGICGTWLEIFGNAEGVWRYPSENSEIMALSFFNSPMAHPTSMMRKELLFKYSLFYDESYTYSSDYEFWVRCGKYFPLANLDEVLFRYRRHGTQIGNRHIKEESQFSDQIRLRQLHELGLDPNSREIELHRALVLGSYFADKKFVESVNKWMLEIKCKNDRIRLYPEPAFSVILAGKWFEVCIASTGLGIWTWKSFWASPLSEYAALSRRTEASFSIKCVLKYGKH